MTYIMRLVGPEESETKKFIFEGEGVPSKEMLKEINIFLKEMTYFNQTIFSECESLSKERGFLLTKQESYSWTEICFCIIHHFKKQFPSVNVLNS